MKGMRKNYRWKKSEDLDNSFSGKERKAGKKKKKILGIQNSAKFSLIKCKKN